MLETLFEFERTLSRHKDAPLLAEREAFLKYREEQGTSRSALRHLSSALLNITVGLHLEPLRAIDIGEIVEAARRWARKQHCNPRVRTYIHCVNYFVFTAKRWLLFLGKLTVPIVPRARFADQVDDFALLRYQYRKSGPWASFTWRFNSGLALPGVVPDYASALELTPDEQAQMGLYCGNVYATRFSPITSCNSPHFGALRVSIPPPGKENDDLWPTRVTERNIFDAGIGIDDLLHTEAYKVQARFTVLNLANTVALYNFLSTFSGTHFVTPRVFQAELRLVF